MLPAPIPALCSVIWPEKYKSHSIHQQTSQIERELPFGRDLLLLCSGGGGSVASLWKILGHGRDASIVFFEGVFRGRGKQSKVMRWDVEGYRQACIEKIALQARASNGGPLATTSETGSSWVSWVTVITPPKEQSLLCRRARVAVLALKAWEMVNVTGSDGSVPPAIVWGCVDDCRDILDLMTYYWPAVHVIPFEREEQALFCLADAQDKSTMMQQYEKSDPKGLSVGCRLFPDVIDTICSCWTIDPQPTPDNQSDKPHAFPSMCNSCSGCLRWKVAFEKLAIDVQHVKISSNEKNDPRHWKNISITVHERRRLTKGEDPWLEKRLRQKGRPKKKAKGKEATPTPQEEEDLDAEEGAEDVEEPNSESDWEPDDSSDSEVEPLLDEEDEEIQDETVDLETAEEFFVEDDEGEGPKRKKSRKKRRFV